MKDNADKNATSIVILQGWVMAVGGKGQTLISCPTSGRFDVKWKNSTMPNICKGDYITFIGRIVTLDLGRSFLVVRAELLKPKSLNRIKQYIKYLKKENVK